MESVRRTLTILAVFSLAPLAGVSCGRSGERAQERDAATQARPPYTYPELRKVSLADRGPECASLSIGPSVAYSGCFTTNYFPLFVYGDLDGALALVAIDTDAVRLIDPGFKIVARSAHFVAILRSEQTGTNDLRFTLMSSKAVRWCRLDRHLFINCQEFVQTG
ncbi:MAG: hypothetical protein QOE09_2618 [Ilumatobacteraceae bacterium]|jgi:hypothetical protein